MFIQSSTLQMNSQRGYASRRTSAQKNENWNNQGFFQNNLYQSFEESSFEKYSGRELESKNEKVKIPEKELNYVQEQQNIMKSVISKRSQEVKALHEKTEISSIRSEIMNYLWRLLFGEESDAYKKWTEEMEKGLRPFQEEGGKSEGFESYEEYEETSFTTTGMVKTADGREISFDVNVHMSRSFMSYYGFSNSYGAEYITMDPLVINTGSSVVTVNDQNFYFDLDCDGKKEKISTLGAGSGFLALDRNNDGIINDGSELFGTKSGDGFKDLSLFDLDYNGWIDEADEIYDSLRIWYADGNCEPKLISLREAGVGAIYLGSTTTDFAMKNGTNEANAFIRNSGIFLYENGNVGTIQHVDMVKKGSLEA